MNYKIPLMKSAFFNEQETRQQLSEFVLKAPRLSMGEQCEEFEIQFAKIHNKKYGILFNSGGSANLALIQALLNLKILSVGDKVAFTALTWATNVMPIIQLGLVPIPVDIDLATLNVMSSGLEKCISQQNPKCVFITNVLGFAGDLGNIKKLCAERNVILIEDNCESLGTELQEGKTGTFGFAGTHSFFIAHHMSTIEGGMIITDDKEMSDMLRMVRANGWTRNLDEQTQEEYIRNYYTKQFESKYTFYCLGYNLRPTEITGFLGLTQLKFLKECVEKRQKNFEFFMKKSNLNTHFKQYSLDHLKTISNFAYPIICESYEKRMNYVKQFERLGIETRPIIAGNILEQPFYRNLYPNTNRLPNIYSVDRYGFYFGNCPDYTAEELEIISNALIAPSIC